MNFCSQMSIQQRKKPLLTEWLCENTKTRLLLAAEQSNRSETEQTKRNAGGLRNRANFESTGQEASGRTKQGSSTARRRSWSGCSNRRRTNRSVEITSV